VTHDGPRRLGRRRLLQTGAAAFGGAGLGWSASAAVGAAQDPAPTPAAGAAADGAAVSSPSPGMELVPFRGRHQAGVGTPPQDYLSLLGLDLHDEVDAAGLSRLMRLLTDDADRLSRGLPALADTEPELAEVPARLTVTFGFGPRIVADLVPTRHGLSLDPLPPFRTDRLDEAWGQTDLAVQLCADDQLTLAHARRMILKDSRAFADVRWIQDGFRRATGDDGVSMRNVLGQVDGTVNPTEADPSFADVVWAGRGTGPAFAGGTFMVVRRIRAQMESWDRVGREGKELAVGRRLDSGAPLTGTAEHDPPDMDATDDRGLPVIDPASHLARARPREPGERILRRPYNYVVPDPSRPHGEDAGLVFVAFCGDVDRQFVPIQQRLAEQDRLNEWVTTIGSAVYAVPPGAAEEPEDPAAPTDHVGRGLLS
jgi:dye decolorizing peroxidase